jgi:oxepin-CoA hydrolase/3-oxo-5,6-dehydrosuberyl-CoA semialdehyde dehydrogenase
MKYTSYALGQWVAGEGEGRPVHHAVTGEEMGRVTSAGLDFKAMLDYGRTVGGPALRKMTFHERALMLKSLALHLTRKKASFYKLSSATGATKKDSWIDIDGGIITFFVYSGKGRRDFPNETFFVDGPTEHISKNGTFVGRHLCVPLEGVATHINAFNFPCWGMLEKLAANFLAGMPAIVKPATASCYLTHLVVQEMIASNILPDGALQLICGGIGDLFDHLTEQDVVTFTGSAETGRMLKSHPKIVENSVRFNMEADSLNCAILGPDALPDSEEFRLFIKEVATEMTSKAGQKCTAIRRTMVPKQMVEPVIQALGERLDKVTVGDPELQEVRMGPLVGRAQVREVREKVETLMRAGKVVYGGSEDYEVVGADREQGAFYPATLLYCEDPFQNREPHDVEAFGPVNTLMPYADLDEAVELARMGRGSLVGSLFTYDADVARKIVLGTAAYHGRIYIMNRDSGKEATGHGSPLPHLVHGGPGRAGGGEEMGGPRAVMHYMQRTALQGSPTILSQVCNEWIEGAARIEDKVHPFRKYFEELQVGETLITHRRTVTEADIVNFACLSGDHFYAHMDAIAAKESPIFDDRVAHGYFLVSAAAGMFVDPAPGPVIANYGLENLRFLEPVYIGDTIHVNFTCKRKTKKFKKEADDVPQGIVEWAVEIINQEDVMVATYSILTLVRRHSWA